jgi:cysteine desulfuration protein SufE
MMVADALAEILEEFEAIEDRTQRFELLFDLADDVTELPTDEWSEGNRVKGCQSQAHIDVRVEDGLVHLRGGADARIVQGLMGLLSLGMNGQTVDVARQVTLDIVEATGLLNSLTPSRSNGFRTMYDMVMSTMGEA